MYPPVLIDDCDAPQARLLLAHGAGAPMDSPFMNSIAYECSQRGMEVVRFEFPFMAQRRAGGKKRPPNTQEVLLETWQTMVDRYSTGSLPLFVGGKSMGGRMATLWAAAARRQPACRGILCLGYPFHPAGKPQRLRIAHLSSLSLPVLIVQGTRDAFGSRDEVAGYALGEGVRFHWIESGDHDLRPLKRSGVTQQQALVEAASAIAAFANASPKTALTQGEAPVVNS